MVTTKNLGISLLEQSQAQKEVTINQAINRIDAILNTGAKSRSLATPPSSPATGDLYIVASSPTGDWVGQAGKLAYFDVIWRFISPNLGLTLWVNDESVTVTHNGSVWLTNAVATKTGASYTLTSGDHGGHLIINNSTAVTLTLPNNLPVNFNCAIIQGGTGQITFSPASGAFLRNSLSNNKSAGRYSACALHIISNSGGAAAEYVLYGDTML